MIQVGFYSRAFRYETQRQIAIKSPPFRHPIPNRRLLSLGASDYGGAMNMRIVDLTLLLFLVVVVVASWLEGRTRGQ